MIRKQAKAFINVDGVSCVYGFLFSEVILVSQRNECYKVEPKTITVLANYEYWVIFRGYGEKLIFGIT